MNIFNSHKIENHLQNHPRGQICPVLTVGCPMLSGFVVEDWKSNFAIVIGCKPDFFKKICTMTDYSIPSGLVAKQKQWAVKEACWAPLIRGKVCSDSRQVHRYAFISPCFSPQHVERNLTWIAWRKLLSACCRCPKTWLFIRLYRQPPTLV